VRGDVGGACREMTREEAYVGCGESRGQGAPPAVGGGSLFKGWACAPCSYSYCTHLSAGQLTGQKFLPPRSHHLDASSG
jgi:hypothetical protein